MIAMGCSQTVSAGTCGLVLHMSSPHPVDEPRLVHMAVTEFPESSRGREGKCARLLEARLRLKQGHPLLARASSPGPAIFRVWGNGLFPLMGGDAKSHCEGNGYDRPLLGAFCNSVSSASNKPSSSRNKESCTIRGM